MKRTILILLSLVFLFSYAEENANREARSLNHRFVLSPEEINLLEHDAFVNADTDAIGKLVGHYGFGVFDYQRDVAWMYIDAIYDRRYMGGLSYCFERAKGSLDIFGAFSNSLDKLKEKGDLFSLFVLYKYYTQSGNDAEASKYKQLLESKNVDKRLLDDAALDDSTPNLNDKFELAYEIIQERDLFEKFLQKNDQAHNVIGRRSLNRYYLVGILTEKFDRKNPSKYSSMPLEIIFFKEKNPYFRARVKTENIISQAFFMVFMGEKLPENLTYAIVPAKK